MRYKHEFPTTLRKLGRDLVVLLHEAVQQVAMIFGPCGAPNHDRIRTVLSKGMQDAIIQGELRNLQNPVVASIPADHGLGDAASY